MSKPVYKVALVGPAGSGKTTHAKRLQKDVGGDVLSFATPLKKLCTDLIPDALATETGNREALQQVGVLFRKLDEDVWVRQLVKKVPTSRSVFVDDCRFLNEYRALKSLGFVFVRLRTHSLELTRRRPGMTPSQHQHESELEQALFHEDFLADTTPGRVEVSDEEAAERGTAWRQETEEEGIERVHAAIVRYLEAQVTATA